MQRVDFHPSQLTMLIFYCGSLFVMLWIGIRMGQKGRGRRLPSPRTDPALARDPQLAIAPPMEISPQITLTNQLDDERRFLRSLLDAIPDIVFIKDVNGVYLGCNTAFATQYVGRPQEEIIGLTDLELVPDQELALNFRKQDLEVIAAGRSIMNDELIPLPDGRQIWVETVKSPYRDRDNRVIGIIGVSRNVTERRELERELDNSRRNLQTILDNLPMLAWLKDGEGRYQFVNQSFVEAVGKQLSEIIGQTDMELWSHDLATSYRDDDWEVMANLKRKHIRERVHAGRGGIWVETFKSVITDDQGSVIGTVGISLDITDRKQAEENMMNILSLQTATLESTADGILVVDCNGRWSTYNQKFLDLWHIPRMDAADGDDRLLQSHGLPQLVDPEAFLENGNELYCQPEAISLDTVAFKDGRVYERYSQPQRVGMTIVGRVWSFRDITQRIGAERELITSSKAAESASRFKSVFLANMSHEIRTPLNAVIGLGYLLLQTELTAQQRDYLGKVDQSARSLLGVINAILDVSRIEAGELLLEEIDFRLMESLKRVMTIVEIQATEKGLDLQLVINGDIPELIRGDSFRLEQVLINLLGNAVKFTNRGLVVLSVDRLDLRGDPQVMLTFTVRDSGIGLSSEQVAGLFRPFSQADASTTRRYGGSGLGLSICKRIVELMNGEITVESVPKQGSTFTVTAQFGYAAQMAESEPDAELPAFHWNQRVRLLVVEDNQINLMIMQEILTRSGILVSSATNGREAVEAVSGGGEARFDAILMDIQMPEMDGYEATRLIRRQWSAEELPIIAMTAHALSEEVQNCLDAGMNDHLAKPVDVEKLYSRLRRWLKVEGESSPEPAAAPHPGGALPVLSGNRPETAALRLNSSLYNFREVIALLRRTHGDDAAMVRRQLAAGDADSALYVIQTVRGIAATIAARSLGEAAAAVESAIKSGDMERAGGLLPAVESSLAAVFQGGDGVAERRG